MPFVLLHGYLESLKIWDAFADKLKNHYRTISIDLPGHGGSGVIAPVHTMELMAECVLAVLDTLAVKKILLAGHSMGGYVALALADLYPERLEGLCLFHSTPFADTEEKKANRDRESAAVKKGKKEIIFQVNIPKGFADDNLHKYHAEVERAREIAFGTPDEGIVAALQGMKERPDRSRILSHSQVPVLWILGRKDNYISYEAAIQQSILNEKGRLLTLDGAGHMGFIEEPETALKGILSFFQNNLGKINSILL